MADAKPTIRKPTTPRPVGPCAPRARSTQTAAKLPHMKTSECAKLIRRSTP